MIKVSSCYFRAALIAVSLVYPVFLTAQEVGPGTPAESVPTTVEEPDSDSDASSELPLAETVPDAAIEPPVGPWGYGELKLGESYERIRELLEQSNDFQYNSQRMSWTADSPTISAEGRGHIRKGYFQFHDQKLYSIILVLDENKLDYYTLFNTFEKRYGAFSELSPAQVKWTGNSSSLALEKPLTVKYLDLELHRQFLDTSMVDKAEGEVSREGFLEKFE